MKCLSCEIEIDPKWRHAIEQNICPFCGQNILEEHLKNLFSSLRETMDALQKYPDQLNDWMLSNYTYIKTDSPDIYKYVPKEMVKELKKIEDEKDFQNKKDSQKFTVKIKNENGQEEEIVAEKIQSEEVTQDFFKRAEVTKTPKGNQHQGPNVSASYQSPAEKTQHLKKVAQQIKRAGTQGLTDVSGGGITISPEMLEQADSDAVAEYQSLISGGEITSSLNDSNDGDDDLPGGDFILQANIAASQNRNGGDSNAKDLAALQNLQNKVTQARRNIASGAKGSFSRS